MTGTWCWVGHMGLTDRIAFALEHHGDKITDVSVFGWNVGTDGTLTQTFDPAQLDAYRAQWPHLRWWLCFRNMDDPNDGPRTIFDALRSDATARATLANEAAGLLDTYAWAYGVDIDLESGGDGDPAASEAIFSEAADAVHGAGGEVSAALPPLTATGSVGGEDWVRYAELGALLDHVAIMSYDFAWAGSAPGPISPGFWLEDVYGWASSQISADKVSMGLPVYAYFWSIHDHPENLSGRLYRGLSGTYYAAWQLFTGFDDWAGDGSMSKIGWICYRDPDSRTLWGFLNAFDWIDGSDYAGAEGVFTDTYQRQDYIVRYGDPSGVPLWDVVNNSAGGAHADYELTAEPVIDVNGDTVGPNVGHTLTAKMLRREPMAATILDDYASSLIQLNDLYVVESGAWDYAEISGQKLYQGTGRLNFDHDFGGSEIATYPDADVEQNGTLDQEQTDAWRWLMDDKGWTSGPTLEHDMQRWLADGGYYVYNIDGDFGPAAIRALQDFLQNDPEAGTYGGAIDGDRGPLTLDAEARYLNLFADPTASPLYVQAQLRFDSTGWAGVRSGGWHAQVAPSGEVRLLKDGTEVESTFMAERPIGSGLTVIGLRIREDSARVYAGASESSTPLRIERTGEVASGGPAGITASADVSVSRIFCGDGWWYQPREAVEVQMGGRRAVLGRVPRDGVTWDSENRFRPVDDVDEPDTRIDSPSTGFSLDWGFEHWRDVPITTGQTVTARVIPLDHDVWFGRLILCDRDGASEVHFADPETIAHWRTRAEAGWGLQGIALWSLGQEDMRLWDTLAGGHLASETKRLNE